MSSSSVGWNRNPAGRLGSLLLLLLLAIVGMVMNNGSRSSAL
jgi:hypothetical protein